MTRNLAPYVFMLLSPYLSALAASTAHADRGVVLYVSPAGSDRWSGRLAAPNNAHTDGPFGTLQRARDAARVLAGSSKITVEVRGGNYYLEAPIVFTPLDSGATGRGIVYTAYRSEHPVFSGGIKITGWTEEANGHWQVVLPAGLADKIIWGPGGLYVNGNRRQRPRLPKSGYFTVAKTVEASPAAEGKGFDRIGYAPGDIDPNWTNMSDIEVLPFHVWTMSRFKVASIDDASKTLTWTGTTAGTESYFSVGQGQRYLLENVKEALGAPGTWYYDKPTRTLTYVPMPGESLETAQIVAPRLEQLVRFDGQKESSVHDIEMRGLSFANTGWNTPDGGNSSAQAEVSVGGAIAAAYTTNCSVDRCRIAHTGGWALDIGDGCSNISVRDCDLVDLGAGGIKIGGEETTHNVTISGVNIAHGGRIHPAAVGIWIGRSSNNTITHNSISDFYYTGISVGWTWGYAPSQANHNIIAYNRIQHIGQGVLSDMGGIYTLGISPGTVLDHNWIRDLRSYDYGGWGIYFDEGSTGISATNNVVFRVKNAGFHQHYGADNMVVNNIFAYGEVAQIRRTRPEDHLSFTFSRNIVIYNRGQLLDGDWSGNHYAFSDNLYWQTDGQAVLFNGESLTDRQSGGINSGSVVANPLFADPVNGNFKLQSGSPAITLGFIPIDISKIGSGRAIDTTVDAPAFPVGFSSH